MARHPNLGACHAEQLQKLVVDVLGKDRTIAVLRSCCSEVPRAIRIRHLGSHSPDMVHRLPVSVSVKKERDRKKNTRQNDKPNLTRR